MFVRLNLRVDLACCSPPPFCRRSLGLGVSFSRRDACSQNSGTWSVRFNMEAAISVWSQLFTDGLHLFVKGRGYEALLCGCGLVLLEVNLRLRFSHPAGRRLAAWRQARTAGFSAAAADATTRSSSS